MNQLAPDNNQRSEGSCFQNAEPEYYHPEEIPNAQDSTYALHEQTEQYPIEVFQSYHGSDLQMCSQYIQPAQMYPYQKQDPNVTTTCQLLTTSYSHVPEQCLHWQHAPEFQQVPNQVQQLQQIDQGQLIQEVSQDQQLQQVNQGQQFEQVNKGQQKQQVNQSQQLQPIPKTSQLQLDLQGSSYQPVFNQVAVYPDPNSVYYQEPYYQNPYYNQSHPQPPVLPQSNPVPAATIPGAYQQGNRPAARPNSLPLFWTYSSGNQFRRPMDYDHMRFLQGRDPTEILASLNSESSGFSTLISQRHIDPRKLKLSLKLISSVCNNACERKKIIALLKTVTQSQKFVVKHLPNYLDEIGTSGYLDVDDIYSLYYLIHILRTLLCVLSPSCLCTLLVIIPRLKNAVKTAVRTRSVFPEMMEEVVRLEKECENIRQGQTPEEDPTPNNFRDIPIFPDTPDLEPQKPFLRSNITVGAYANVEHYLDVHFRLLREDFIQPLRKGLLQYLDPSVGRRTNQHKLYIYDDVEILSSLRFNEGVIFDIRFDVSKIRGSNWESKRLRKGSLVSLSGDHFKTLFFGTVAVRTIEALKDGVVSVKFEDKDTLIREAEKHKFFVMIETEAYFEGYRHVLTALQEMDESNFPLKEYIIGLQTQIEPPGYVKLSTYFCFPTEYLEMDRSGCQCTKSNSIGILGEKAWPTASQLGVDPFQLAAMRCALTQKLSIIQGPPGTGKTFIGLRILELLIHNCRHWMGTSRNSHPILVICYTNHALDQFLEGVLEFTKDLVRIGVNKGSRMLDYYNLTNLNGGFLRNDKYRTDIGLGREYNKAKFKVQGLSQNIKKLESELRSLRQEISNEYQLQNLIKPYRFDSLLGEAPKYINKQEGSLLTQWLGTSGQLTFAEKLNSVAALSPEEEVGLGCNMWNISLEDRWRLYRTWVAAVETKLHRQREIDIRDYDRNYHTFIGLKNERDLVVASKALVIGMTTTGAAKYRQLVRKLQPKIVIVEEAAEVLESHIVTSLGKDIEQLILIGDHQQLRPSTTVYELATKYKLDVSLFERLINNGMPFTRLAVQHRMKPCISKLLVPHVYHKLFNDVSVYKYNDVKGLEKSMFFVDHRFPETSLGDSDKSKINEHEAKFLVALCKYLLDQGYSPTQITIMATYLGQMFKIKQEMRNKIEGVKVVVVDSFQGEENDIILLSCVRSNDRGEIGYLNNENRICVALSRAKIGLICIGNFDLLRSKSTLWNNIVTDLTKSDSIGPELALKCQKHCRITRVSKQTDISALSNGGCDLICNYRLSCGHVCSKLCHPEDHKSYICPRPCDNFCTARHKCQLRCFETCQPCCVLVERILTKCQHKVLVVCSQPAEQIVCHKPCEKKRLCGHNCKLKCGEECGNCLELIKVTAECGHEVLASCSSHKLDSLSSLCMQFCERQLPCGHKCLLLCGMACQATNCSVELDVTMPCGHRTKAVCKQTHQMDILISLCEEPCGKTLNCGHKCSGTCGKCFQGRIHQRCAVPCGRILVCGHTCATPCQYTCPPCQRLCDNRCSHSVCQLPCGVPCTPCKEICRWKCQHHECSRLCNEACDRPPCNHPCSLFLTKCGHPCVGLCGEPCPSLCRICNKAELTEILFGYENDEDVRFIVLEDCGHTFEVNGISKWLEEQSNPTSGDVHILRCPICRVVIRRNLHFNSYVKTSLNKIEAVKKKIFGDTNAIKQKRVEVLHSVQRATLVRSEDPNCPGQCQTALDSLLKQLISGQFLCMDVLLLYKHYGDVLHRIKFLDIRRPGDVSVQSCHRQLIEAEKYLDNSCKTIATTIEAHLLDGSLQQIEDIGKEVKRLRMLVNFVNECLSSEALTDEAKDLFKSGIELLISAHAFETEDFQAVRYIKIDLHKLIGGGFDLNEDEKLDIVSALGFSKQGHWYQCPTGHIYCVTECGAPVTEGLCPECRAPIGGHAHLLREDNIVATVMDGATEPAYTQED